MRETARVEARKRVCSFSRALCQLTMLAMLAAVGFILSLVLGYGEITEKGFTQNDFFPSVSSLTAGLRFCLTSEYTLAAHPRYDLGLCG